MLHFLSGEVGTLNLRMSNVAGYFGIQKSINQSINQGSLRRTKIRLDDSKKKKKKSVNIPVVPVKNSTMMHSNQILVNKVNHYFLPLVKWSPSTINDEVKWIRSLKWMKQTYLRIFFFCFQVMINELHSFSRSIHLRRHFKLWILAVVLRTTEGAPICLCGVGTVRRSVVVLRAERCVVRPFPSIHTTHSGRSCRRGVQLTMRMVNLSQF